jgi:hypothetical protein
MTIFLGLNLANVIGTNVLPNEPVPPVIRIEVFVSMVLLLGIGEDVSIGAYAGYLPLAELDDDIATY